MFKQFFKTKKFSPRLAEKIAALESTLEDIAAKHVPATLASRLSAADMVMTHVILRRSLDISIVALESAPLGAEALNLIKSVRQRYQYTINRISPVAGAILGAAAWVVSAPSADLLAMGGNAPVFPLLRDWTNEEIQTYLDAYGMPYTGSAALNGRTADFVEPRTGWRTPCGTRAPSQITDMA